MFTPKQQYSITLYSCPAMIPFWRVRHTWIEIQEGEQRTRYEVTHFKNNKGTYIQKNYYPYGQGTPLLPWTKKYRGKSRKEGEISGEDIKKIHNHIRDYAYAKRYILFPGPNSNTFIKYLLKSYPKLYKKIPWNALGI